MKVLRLRVHAKGFEQAAKELQSTRLRLQRPSSATNGGQGMKQSLAPPKLSVVSEHVADRVRIADARYSIFVSRHVWAGRDRLQALGQPDAYLRALIIAEHVRLGRVGHP
eukprot:scaffold1355_cov268-Pinguiococcus_pyrenoidosus.AAC.86